MCLYIACRQHEGPARFYDYEHMHYLGRMSAAIAALGAMPGDLLCFEPSGPAATYVTLRRAAKRTSAALQAEEQQLPSPPPAQQQGQKEAGAAVSQYRSMTQSSSERTNRSAESSDCSGLGHQPAAKRRKGRNGEAGHLDAQHSKQQQQQQQQQIRQPLPPPAQQQQQQQQPPRQPNQLPRQPNQQFATTWQGLEPEDLGCYAVPLAAMSVGPHHKLSIPCEGRPLAAFAHLCCAPVPQVQIDAYPCLLTWLQPDMPRQCLAWCQAQWRPHSRSSCTPQTTGK